MKRVLTRPRLLNQLLKLVFVLFSKTQDSEQNILINDFFPYISFTRLMLNATSNTGKITPASMIFVFCLTHLETLSD